MNNLLIIKKRFESIRISFYIIVADLFSKSYYFVLIIVHTIIKTYIENKMSAEGRHTPLYNEAGNATFFLEMCHPSYSHRPSQV